MKEKTNNPEFDEAVYREGEALAVAVKQPQKAANNPEAKVARWLKEFNQARDSKKQKAFETNGEKIVKKYRSADALDRSDDKPSRCMYNVLWSNVQIQKPLLFARVPKTIVERRHKDSDDLGRVASMAAERGVSFMVDTQRDRYKYSVGAAVEDRLIVGRGVCSIRYDADFGTNSDSDQVSGGEVLDAAAPEGEEEEAEGSVATAEPTPLPNSERCIIDYVPWTDFFHNPARSWYEVKKVYKLAYMTRQELVERFGDIGKLVELSTDKRKKRSQEDEEFLGQAEVVECWDITSKTAYWFSDGYKEAALDEQPDPLGLKDFFPYPIPLFATNTTDDIYPTPDYKIYEPLAEEADYVTRRISEIADCIRVVGAHAASIGDKLKNIVDLPNGKTFPIENWAQFMGEKGGLASAINWFPFDQAVDALGPLTAYRDGLLQQIDLLTGIPDLMRGATDARETASAIQEKSHWVSLKAEEKQADVQRFCREINSKIAEVMFQPGLFSDETLYLMCGVAQMSPEDQELWPAALALLRNDRLLTFRVDIETDSTISMDEEADKASRMETLGAITNLFSNVQNVSQFRPELMDPMLQSAIFAIRAFRNGRSLEGSFERAVQLIKDNDAAAAENPPEQPPDPAFAKIEVDKQRLMQDAELTQQKLQQEGMFKSQELQLKSQELGQAFELGMAKVQIEGQKVMGEQQFKEMDQGLKQFQEEFRQYAEQQRLELEKYETVLSEREKLLEEQRLKGEQTLETVRLLQERSKAAEEGASKAPPAIHVYTGGGSKEIRMKRDVDGSLVGHARELPGAE